MVFASSAFIFASTRLQNSRIFCEREQRSIFERKVWSECKNSEGESRASHSRITLAYVASRLPKTSENDCFAVYASTSSDQFSHASTFEITNGEQQALRKFSASWNLSLLKRCFAPSNLADTFKNTGQKKQDNKRKARQHVKTLSPFNYA